MAGGLIPSSGTARTAQNVRDAELARREREAAASLHDEAGAVDGGTRVTRQMAAAGHVRVEGLVEEALHSAPARAVRDDVLIEAQLAARPDHAVQLAERTV